MKKHSFLKFTLSFFILLMFFYSCEKEEATELEITQETEVVQPTEQEIISSKFSLDGFDGSSDIAKNSLKILWNEHKKVTLEEREWHEYKMEELVKIDLEEGEITDITYSLLATMIDDNPAYWLLRMDSRNGEAYSSYFDLEKGGFTGMTYLYNLKGEMSMARYYQKGNGFHGITKIGNPIALPAPSASRCDFKVTSSNCAGTSDCGLLQSTGGSGCGNGGGKGGYRRVRIPGDIIDRYNDHNNDGKGQPNEYSHTIFMPDRYKWVWVSNTSSGHIPQRGQQYQGIRSDGSIRNIPRPSAQPKRIIIDKSVKSNPCVKRVLDILTTSMSNHLLKQTIGKFKKDAEFKLTFSVGAMPKGNSGADAITLDRVTSNDEIRIIINKNNANNNPLELARLLIHEAIHAEIIRHVHKKSRNQVVEDRARLFQLFSYHIGLLSKQELDSPHLESHIRKKMSKAQHDYMSERFIKPIAQALHQFDGGKFTLKDYESLAWVGLEETYNYLGRMTEAERNRIEQKSAEILNKALNHASNICK
ncbi:hypothetical protein [Flagellimonas onchidii]|uniref:hypothetical protein n=1 Tax=Flagellimonas onchidii TaxID=2562684 RepID=UPI0010A6444B|nr:hypothetical protein [Allomuricauda onchidii]